MDHVIIPVVAILMPLGIVTLVTRAKHRARVRDYEHRERMRALEVGISPYQAPGGTAWPALVALGIGALMPVGVFFMSWLATMTSHVGDEVYFAAMLVSGAGVIGGTRMGFRLLQNRGASSPPAQVASTPSRQANGRKPAFDPEAYDVIAHRG